MICNLFNESFNIASLSLLIIVLSYYSKNKTILYVSLSVFVFLLFFYRYPLVSNPYSISNNVILSPAYGTIKKIVNDGKNITIIIFLSPLDVHVQYYPTNGNVINQIHDLNGNFELAYKINKSSQNEKVITVIKPLMNIGGNIMIKQIAGFCVRRITTTLKYIGEYVNVGQKMGMIKFGSRVDITVPADNFKLYVTEGDTVKGFNTIVGIYT